MEKIDFNKTTKVIKHLTFYNEEYDIKKEYTVIIEDCVQAKDSTHIVDFVTIHKALEHIAKEIVECILENILIKDFYQTSFEDKYYWVQIKQL